jgi:hypothetical protein
MPDQSLLDIVRPLLPAAPDPEAELARLLASLLVPDPAPAAGPATPSQGALLNFVLAGGGLSLRASQSVPAGLSFSPGVWEWPGQVQYNLVAPQGQLERLELDLGPLAVRLPFLRGALQDNDTLQPDPANPEVHLRLSGANLVITPAADGGLQSTLTAANANASMTPAFALVGPLDFVGFGFSSASLASGAGPETLEFSDVRLFAQPPGIPSLALQSAAQNLQIHLGANPGVSGTFEVDMAGQAAAAAHPHFLSGLRWQVRLDHNILTAFEVHGQVDFQSAVEQRLGGVLPDVQAQPADFELAVSFDQGDWRARLAFGAGVTPETGLVSARRNGSPAANNLLDMLGLLAAFAPLLNPNPPDPNLAPQAGEYMNLAVTPALTGVLSQSGLLQVTSFSLQGGELVTRKLATGSYETIFMLDLQTDMEVKAKIGGVPLVESTPGRPLRVRHQAIGLRLIFGNDPDHPTFQPVFDPGKGFSLGVSDPGMFKVPKPLGDILQVLGVRLARTNPLNLEIDLGLPTDLGVVSVDRARLRIPLDQPALPSLTALGAGMDIGAVKGKGYLSINSLPNGDAVLAGGLDASLVPLGLRVAAKLKLAQISNPPATGVLVALQVDFPIPLPLYSSGLGLFGLAGLFAMHYKRDENSNHPQPALDWFENRAQGDPTAINAWVPDVNRWAFGVGAVLGTMEGGFVLNMNGMLMLELPGPRLLIFMGARLLLPRPGTKEKTPGNLLAVIDVSDTAFRIGLTAQYGIPPIYEVRVPVGAVFPYPNNAEKFEVDLGRISDPVTVKYLFVFRGTGYLMIHGAGIPDFPLGALHGFSVAVGAHAEIIWGSEDVGLYLKVAAGLDVGVSFKPFLLLGRMSLSGELHVFIAGLEVSSQADVKVVQKSDNLLDFDYYVKAEVCGEIDLWLDSIKGCVTIELGSEPALPAAPALVRAVSLHSRTPARLQGSSAEHAIDGSLGEAAPDPNPDPAHITTPVVPIDAVPVIQFEMAPVVDQVSDDQWPFGERPKNRPPLPSSGWTRRGERFYRYTLQSVKLEGPVGSGEKPSVWWSRHSQPAGDDNDVQLALLNWTPNPTPQAALRTIHQEREVTKRWGTVCLPIVEPTPVLWSFHQTPLGLSSSGWRMTGTPLPDPPDATRSAPPPLILQAREAWRTGNSLVDALLPVTPARVIAPSAQLPGRVLTAPYTPYGLRLVADNPTFTPLVDEAVTLAFSSGPPLDDALRLSGLELRSVRLLVWMMDDTLNDHFTLRALDAAGNELQAPLPFDLQVIHQAGDWLPAGHPWFNLVDQALKQIMVLDLSPAFLLSSDLPDGTAQIEMGLRDMDEILHERFKEFAAPYLLLAVEGMPVSEFLRFKYDETTQKSTRTMLDGYLSSDPSKQALLKPDTSYSVVVAYSVEVGEEADPKDPNYSKYLEAPNSRNALVKVKPVATQNPSAQRFTFHTDRLPPRRLDPWVLAVQPGEGDGFHFWGDPIQVVFSTNATRQLYAAYQQRQLRGRVRAASFRHAVGSPTHQLTSALLDPTVALAALTPQASAILTPFEESLRLALRDQDCVPAAHTLPLSQEKWDLNLLLDPLTDYVFDIEAEPGLPQEPNQPSRPLYRRSFTTSRYKSLEEMIAAISSAPLRHRRLANPKPLVDLAVPAGAGPQAVRELDFEMALRQSGWGDLRPPDAPEVTIIWDDQSPPQPAAVLLNLPEPLWRWRQTPEKHIDPADPLKTETYMMKRQPWLELAEAGGPVVRRFVFTSGGGRSLVVMQANARGANLSLVVRRSRTKLLDGSDGLDSLPLRSLSLTEAPWESV